MEQEVEIVFLTYETKQTDDTINKQQTRTLHMEEEVEIVILAFQTILLFSFVEIGAQLSNVLVWLVIGDWCSLRLVLNVHHVN